MTTAQKIADSIDKLMYDQGKKNKELSELLDVTQIQASLMRRGKSSIDVDDLFTVSRWLGVTTEDLARGYELVPMAA